MVDNNRALALLTFVLLAIVGPKVSSAAFCPTNNNLLHSSSTAAASTFVFANNMRQQRRRRTVISFLASSSTELENDETTTTVRTTQEKKKPLVQRQYETFLWHHNLHSYNINYRVEGPLDGTPILLVHGFGANVNHFRFQFPSFAKAGYRVYAIDLLGFGASDKPKEEDYCIELWVELLVDFVKAMDYDKKWVIAGNSIGGLCSLSTSEKLPNLIKGCVLLNCSGGMTGFRYEELPWFLKPILYMVQKVVFGPQMGASFFQNFKTRENVESILLQQGVYRDTTNVDEELMEMLLGPSEDDGAQDVFLKVFSGPAGPTPESILPNVYCPILALWGDADPWTPVDRGMHPGNTFDQYIPEEGGSYKLVVLQGVGHCPHDECPDVINENMIQWMADLPKDEA